MPGLGGRISFPKILRVYEILGRVHSVYFIIYPNGHVAKKTNPLLYLSKKGTIHCDALPAVGISTTLAFLPKNPPKRL
jgi:hypothetical protein